MQMACHRNFKFCTLIDIPSGHMLIKYQVTVIIGVYLAAIFVIFSFITSTQKLIPSRNFIFGRHLLLFFMQMCQISSHFDGYLLFGSHICVFL